MDRPKKIVKCEGRFHELREYLFGTPIDLILDGRTLITPQDLRDLWSLIENDIYQYDTKDPYYQSSLDKARKKPSLGPNSLVPLFPTDYVLEISLISVYGLGQGIKVENAARLEQLASQGERFFVETLAAETRDIIFPKGQDLAGYTISTHFGIGTLSHGGVSGAGIRSDAPFLIEIYKKEAVTEKNLAAVIGFWAQEDTMLVSQMQACRNAQLPLGISLGVGGLVTAEFIARKIGFKYLELYSARAHPIFRVHPGGWNQFGKDFIENSHRATEIIGGYLPSDRDSFVKEL
ncbi:MAG: hypothetical protein Q8R18_05115 [bacterium]|nr:hypothetical protein [bacterium]